MAIPLDAEHQVVLDELACRRLLERYSYAEIARDPDLFASVWTEDALFGKVRGRDNIRDACLEFLKHMETIRELRISPAGAHVEVDGDAAIGTYFVVSHLCVPSEEGPERVMIFDASYHAEFARTAEGWRISRLCGIKDPDEFHDLDIRATVVNAGVDFKS